MSVGQEWNAVVLGGGDPADAFAAAHHVSVKPLIELQGQAMGAWVLRALKTSGRVAQVAYVGPLTSEMADLVDVRVTDRGTLLANLEAGVAALSQLSQAPKRVLVVTADVPLLSAEMVQSVLDSAPDVPLVYPVVEKSVCDAAYPGVKRTYVRLKDGTFTGGNLFLLDPALIAQFLPRLKAVLGARKQPLKLAAIIGPGALLRLLTGRLSVVELEARVSRILGVQAQALITPHAAVGTDVDKEDDLQLATAALAGNLTSGAPYPVPDK